MFRVAQLPPQSGLYDKYLFFLRNGWVIFQNGYTTLCSILNVFYYYNYVFMCISRCGYVYVFAVPVGAKGPGHGVTGKCSRSLIILNIFFREVCVKITLARHDS